MNNVGKRAGMIAIVGAVIVVAALLITVHFVNKNMLKDISQLHTIPVWRSL